MEMQPFKLIGIKLSHKTKNENRQSEKDCGSLWQQFEAQKIFDQVPYKISNAVYAVYYDYDSDENGLFSYFIGCKVDSHATAPKNLQEISIPEQQYEIETARGQMTGCLSEAWQRIWNATRNRKFGYDFEIYDERSYDWNNAEVEIYLSVK